MSAIHRLALAALLTGVIASAPALAQTASAPGASNRAAIAAKYNRKMPECKARAKREKISLSAHRAFMRQCLKN